MILKFGDYKITKTLVEAQGGSRDKVVRRWFDSIFTPVRSGGSIPPAATTGPIREDTRAGSGAKPTRIVIINVSGADCPHGRRAARQSVCRTDLFRCGRALKAIKPFPGAAAFQPNTTGPRKPRYS